MPIRSWRGAPRRKGESSTSGLPCPTRSSSWEGSSAKRGVATVGRTVPSADHDLLAQALREGVAAERYSLSVKAVRSSGQRSHSLLDLPLVGLVQDRTYDLLDPHGGLPAPPVLLRSGLVAQGGGRVAPVPPRGVPQGVPNGVDSFFSEHLDEAGYARPL